MNNKVNLKQISTLVGKIHPYNFIIESFVYEDIIISHPSKHKTQCNSFFYVNRLAITYRHNREPFTITLY